MKEELETKYVSLYFYKFRLSPSVQPHRSKTIILPHRHDIKDHRNKGTEKKSSHVKCDNCQGYGHIIDTCASLFRVVIIDGVLTATPMLYNIIPPVVTFLLRSLVMSQRRFTTNHHRYVTPNLRLNLIPKSLHIIQR